jgi:hypothetical protein
MTPFHRQVRKELRIQMLAHLLARLSVCSYLGMKKAVGHLEAALQATQLEVNP